MALLKVLCHLISSEYSVSVEQFKIKDSGSYDAVAEHFAHFTGIVTKPLAETMVRLADLHIQRTVSSISEPDREL